MAFVTRVVIEGAGESPDAIRAVLDGVTEAVSDELGEDVGNEDGSVTNRVCPEPRVTAEVYDRAKSGGHALDWYKGRRVVWFVEPGGANDPDGGKEK